MGRHAWHVLCRHDGHLYYVDVLAKQGPLQHLALRRSRPLQRLHPLRRVEAYPQGQDHA